MTNKDKMFLLKILFLLKQIPQSRQFSDISVAVTQSFKDEINDLITELEGME